MVIFLLVAHTKHQVRWLQHTTPVDGSGGLLDGYRQTTAAPHRPLLSAHNYHNAHTIRGGEAQRERDGEGNKLSALLGPPSIRVYYLFFHPFYLYFVECRSHGRSGGFSTCHAPLASSILFKTPLFNNTVHFSTTPFIYLEPFLRL